MGKAEHVAVVGVSEKNRVWGWKRHWLGFKEREYFLPISTWPKDEISEVLAGLSLLRKQRWRRWGQISEGGSGWRGEWRYGPVRSAAAACGHRRFRLTSFRWSEFVEKTEVEEMRERHEAVLLLLVKGVRLFG